MIKNKLYMVIIIGLLFQHVMTNAMGGGYEFAELSELEKTKLLLAQKKEEFGCEVNKSIAEKKDLNQEYANSGLYFLEYAVSGQMFDVAENLLKYGINTESRKSFYTPLYYAVNDNNEKMVKLLLHYKADPNSMNSKYKPLVLTTQKGNFFLQKLLLKHGAHPDIGELTIFQNGHYECFTALFASVCYDGYRYVSEFVRKKLVQQLLAYNADITYKYADITKAYEIRLLTAEQWARKNGYFAIANTIKNYYPSKKELFEIVQKKEKEIAGQDVEKVKQLAKKITFKIKDEKGNTPLHYCVANRHQGLSGICLQVLPKLIKMKNKNGETPLHLAAINNHAFLNFVIN